MRRESKSGGVSVGSERGGVSATPEVGRQAHRLHQIEHPSDVNSTRSASAPALHRAHHPGARVVGVGACCRCGRVLSVWACFVGVGGVGGRGSMDASIRNGPKIIDHVYSACAAGSDQPTKHPTNQAPQPNPTRPNHATMSKSLYCGERPGIFIFAVRG